MQTDWTVQNIRHAICYFPLDSQFPELSEFALGIKFQTRDIHLFPYNSHIDHSASGFQVRPPACLSLFHDDLSIASARPRKRSAAPLLRLGIAG
jgi:hypothetical protein